MGTRPLSRGVARADRSQAEGGGDQAASGHHAAPGDRFDGGSETQSGTGNTCHRRRVRQTKASQADSRSAPAVIAATGSRRQKKESKARDRSSRRRHEAAKEGVNIAEAPLRPAGFGAYKTLRASRPACQLRSHRRGLDPKLVGANRPIVQPTKVPKGIVSLVGRTSLDDSSNGDRRLIRRAA